MKFLFIADIHIGKNNDKQKYQCIEKFFYSKIEELGNTLDMIIIGGDTSDRNLSFNEEAGKLYNTFFLKINEYSKKYNIIVRVIKGTRGHEYDQLRTLKQLELENPKFKVIESVQVEYLNINKEVRKFLYVPEEYMEDPKEYYKEYLYKDMTDEDKYDYIFGHGTFEFSGYTNETSTTERHMKNAPTFNSKLFDSCCNGITLFGHVHTRMDKNNVYYSGSFSRDGFGEDEEKGYYMVDESDEGIELDFIENEDAPTYVTLNYELIKDKDPKEFAKIIGKYKKKYDHIRIKANSTIENESDIEILKKLNKDDIKVESYNKIQKNEEENSEYDYILKRQYDIPTTISKYIKKSFGVTIKKEKIGEYISEESD